LAKLEPPPIDTGDQPHRCRLQLPLSLLNRDPTLSPWTSLQRQPNTATSLTLPSSLLLITTHYREDDEIRSEAEGQKPHLKRKKNTGSRSGSPGSWVDPPGLPSFAGLLHRSVF
jgi:hypothetical protein